MDNKNRYRPSSPLTYTDDTTTSSGSSSESKTGATSDIFGRFTSRSSSKESRFKDKNREIVRVRNKEKEITE